MTIASINPNCRDLAPIETQGGGGGKKSDNDQSKTEKLSMFYEKLIKAIGSWGKVLAILMADYGFNHTVIVQFNSPIAFVKKSEKMLRTSCGHGITGTPFSLRGMPSKEGSYSLILSENMMAFDFYGHLKPCLFEQKSMRLYQLVDNQREKLKEFNEKSFFDWIRVSGNEILSQGIHKSGEDNGEYSVDEIIDCYKQPAGGSWQVMRRYDETNS